jgi:hypothetical protein
MSLIWNLEFLSPFGYNFRPQTFRGLRPSRSDRALTDHITRCRSTQQHRMSSREVVRISSESYHHLSATSRPKFIPCSKKSIQAPPPLSSILQTSVPSLSMLRFPPSTITLLQLVVDSSMLNLKGRASPRNKRRANLLTLPHLKAVMRLLVLRHSDDLTGAAALANIEHDYHSHQRQVLQVFN